MKPNLLCIVDNTEKRWFKNGLLHREDGPAVIKGSGNSQMKEYWLEGVPVNPAMLELQKTLTHEVDEIMRRRKVVSIDALRLK